LETLEKKIRRVLEEEIAVVPYDPRWPELFELERKRLPSLFPGDLIKRIEHFGSTAVPGLPAKPIVDMLVEVRDLKAAKRLIAPALEDRGYDYFWRPLWDEEKPPFYAWFIKRDSEGKRTHHIHMVEAHFEHWDRLLFRDYLIEHPEVAREYGDLKLSLSQTHKKDRTAYTKAKSDFIKSVTKKAKILYAAKR
jgi:GrpB-like predicted nucleotidyltransferase (UPF0157 family)